VQEQQFRIVGTVPACRLADDGRLRHAVLPPEQHRQVAPAFHMLWLERNQAVQRLLGGRQVLVLLQEHVRQEGARQDGVGRQLDGRLQPSTRLGELLACQTAPATQHLRLGSANTNPKRKRGVPACSLARASGSGRASPASNRRATPSNSSHRAFARYNSPNPHSARNDPVRSAAAFQCPSASSNLPCA